MSKRKPKNDHQVEAVPEDISAAIKEAFSGGRVTFADQFKIDEYPEELGCVLESLGIKNGWFSDESCFGDFYPDRCNDDKLLELSSLCKMDVTYDTLLWEACASMRRGAH